MTTLLNVKNLNESTINQLFNDERISGEQQLNFGLADYDTMRQTNRMLEQALREETLANEEMRNYV